MHGVGMRVREGWLVLDRMRDGAGEIRIALDQRVDFLDARAREPV